MAPAIATTGSGAGVSFREAAAGDIPQLLELQKAYYAEDGYPFDPRIAGDTWGALLADSSLGRAWAAEAAAEIVGYIVLALGYSLEYRGRDGFVDELYFTPAWRGLGLGGHALDVVDATCRSLGIKALHLEVERDKPGALALYRRWGFEEHDRVLMTKRIETL